MCAIVQGELMYMVERSDRKLENLKAVQLLPTDLDVYPTDSEASIIYGRMKAALINR